MLRSGNAKQAMAKSMLSQSKTRAMQSKRIHSKAKSEPSQSNTIAQMKSKYNTYFLSLLSPEASKVKEQVVGDRLQINIYLLKVFSARSYFLFGNWLQSIEVTQKENKLSILGQFSLSKSEKTMVEFEFSN